MKEGSELQKQDGNLRMGESRGGPSRLFLLGFTWVTLHGRGGLYKTAWCAEGTPQRTAPSEAHVSSVQHRNWVQCLVATTVEKSMDRSVRACVCVTET